MGWQSARAACGSTKGTKRKALPRQRAEGDRRMNLRIFVIGSNCGFGHLTTIALARRGHHVFAGMRVLLRAMGLGTRAD